MGRVQGRVAIVTGAARGMGACHARVLAAEGARVVLTDVDAAGAEVAAGIGDAALFVRHDVRSADDWARVVAAAEGAFGSVDILVNNAGTAVHEPIESMSEERFRREWEVNTLGVFLGMKAVAGPMARAGRGSIVNICSISSLVGEAGAVGYTASKFAAYGMTRVAAKEFGPKGIRVNSVHPGPIDTPMLHDAPGSEEAILMMKEMSPLGRIGAPEDVSAVVLFLASDDAGYVTGSGYVVDGGLLA
ncbi:glucose 1-dehydrogenase [Actinocorallia aurea]